VGQMAQTQQFEQFVRIGDGLAPQLLPAARLRTTGACGYHCHSDDRNARLFDYFPF
jgi:hypothetical protein